MLMLVDNIAIAFRWCAITPDVIAITIILIIFFHWYTLPILPLSLIVLINNIDIAININIFAFHFHAIDYIAAITHIAIEFISQRPLIDTGFRQIPFH